MRDMGTIMDEIGAKWSSMSVLEQNQLAYVIAGVRQRNIFIAAMEDYNKVLDATEVAENANGVAAEKMTVYNESLAAAQNRLTASIQQFAQDSNLDQILAKAYDALSKIVDILNMVINKSGILSPLIKALGVALATTFAAGMIQKAKDTGGAITSLVQALTGVQATSGAVVGVIPALQAALTGLTGVLAGTTTAASAFGAVMTAMGGPVGVAIAAIGALLVILPKVVDAFNDFKNAKEKALEKSTQDLEDANQNLEETNSQIKDIQDKIAEINSKGTLTLTDQAEKDRLEEQLDTLKEIRDIQEEIARAKAEEQAQDVRDVVKSKYSESINDDDTYGLLAESGKTHDLADTVYPAESASVQELAANIRYLNEQKMALTGTEEDYAERLKEINSLETENRTKLLEEKKELLEYKQTLESVGDTSSKEYNDIVDRINEINVVLDPSKFPKINLSEMIEGEDGLERKLQAIVKVGSEKGRELAKGYAEQFANEIASPGNEVELQAWKKALNIPDAQELGVPELIQEILNLIYQMYGDIEDSSDSAVQSFSSQFDVFEKYRDEITKIHDSTTDLTAAYQDMTDKGYLSETVVKKLTAAHPELTKQLKLENGQYKINIEVLKEANDAAYNESIATIKAQKEETQVVIDSTWDRIRMVNREIRALKAKAMVTGDEADQTRYVNAERELGDLMTQMQGYTKAMEEADAKIAQLEKERDTWSPPSTKTSSGKSAADKAAKEFENSVKEKIKNLKGIVTLYSQQEDWMSSEVIKKYTDDYNEALDEIVNNPKARQIAADALNIDISKMSTQEAIDAVTKLLKEQAGTIEEARQKLQTNYLKGLKEAEEAEKKQYEEAVKQIEALNKMTKEMIETGIDLLEKAGDFIFDMLDKVSERYDKQIDNLDKIMDELDDQKDAFDDKIDAQKEYLKLQKEEIDNQNELAEKTKSIADIDARLTELQYDNSAAAQTERLKLLDERAQKEKELKEFQDETAYDAQTKALDAQKKQFDDSIEAQKKALEQQKEALEASQEKFESTVSSIKSAFDGFIKILNTDVFKNLATNLLNSVDGDTLTQALYAWNKVFGTGLDADVTNTLGVYNTLSKYGWKRGMNIQDFQNILTQGTYTKEQVLDLISQATTANSAGNLDISSFLESINTLNQSFNVFETNATASVKRVGEATQSTIQELWNGARAFLNQEASTGSDVVEAVAKGVTSTIKSSKKGITSLIPIVTQANQIVGQNGQEMISQIGDVAKGVLSYISGTGVGSIGSVVQTGGSLLGKISGIALNLVSGITTVGSNSISTLASVGMQALSSILGISSSLGMSSGQLYSGSNSLNTTGTNLLESLSGSALQLGISLGMKTGHPLIGTAIGAAAGATWSTMANVSKLWKSNQSFGSKLLGTAVNLTPIGLGINLFKSLFGRHHSGADYVKKQNPELDKMLGLGSDETVSILKVGEAVVPTWANNASVSASGNTYTGDTATQAVASAKRTSRLPSPTVGDNSIVNTISMPITIQGNADASTVKLLKEQSENIAKSVFKMINKQTNMSGYRNIRGATV